MRYELAGTLKEENSADEGEDARADSEQGQGPKKQRVKVLRRCMNKVMMHDMREGQRRE